MIASLWQIDFISDPAIYRLLDYGDLIDGEVAPKVAQQADTISPIGARWAKGTAPTSGAVVNLSWTVQRNHESHQALRAFCLRHVAQFPAGKVGALRLSIEDGEVWDITDCVIGSSEPMPHIQSGGFSTLTSYSATGGKLVPVSGLAQIPGTPHSWIMRTPEEITETHSQM